MEILDAVTQSAENGGARVDVTQKEMAQ